MSLRSLALWAAAGRISLIGWQADAATFVKADVTTLLGPTFFVDDAVEAAVTAVAAPANASG